MDSSSTDENTECERKRDASTSTENPQNHVRTLTDPRPLSYTLIDFDTTKALTESAQAHAANRFK